MKADIHTTTLRLPTPLWDAVRFLAYLKDTSANGAIIQILKETLPNHLDSLEYNTLDWDGATPNNPETKNNLRSEFQKHQRNLQNLGADE